MLGCGLFAAEPAEEGVSIKPAMTLEEATRLLSRVGLKVESRNYYAIIEPKDLQIRYVPLDREVDLRIFYVVSTNKISELALMITPTGTKKNEVNLPLSEIRFEKDGQYSARFARRLPIAK
jgi:hypothetical protein